VEQQAESCCRHARACRVFLAVLGTHKDVQFHTDHQRTVADSDDNQACQLPPNIHTVGLYKCTVSDTFSSKNCLFQHIMSLNVFLNSINCNNIISTGNKLVTFHAILLPFVSCSNATGKSPRS